MVLLDVVANCPFVYPLQSQIWKSNQLAHLYLLLFGLPKIVSPQSFFIISIIFLTISKYFSNLNNGKDLSEEEEE
jgi:hypothetical protein